MILLSKLMPNSKHSSMSEDFTLKNPQMLLKRSFNIRAGTNPGSPYGSDLSNLDFSKFPQLCIYLPNFPPRGILPLSCPFESHLNNLGFSRFPHLCIYLPNFPPCGILPLSVVSIIISDPPKPQCPFESHLNNLGFSRFPHLCLYLSITLLGGILPSVMSDPSTSLSLSLPGIRSNKNLNRINRIEQVVEMKPVVASKLTTSLNLSLPGFKSSKNSNWVNQIEQIV
ncbi:hypothetical protein H5410_063214 [Solanum commersonii]|uniref:Uncharacterized protein n=1 Tax=Solanum commersonii TaxID=4109 RepID=A0A9J5WEM7_SOLCO|nr:hypothetical protein H5410_063214 [Solanum commersonii]